MDTKITYLGLQLPHPFIVGACPLADSVDSARLAEQGGAAAIVLRSLFEEQIHSEGLATLTSTDGHSESFADALTKVEQLRAEIKTAFTADDLGKADGPVHEIGHLLLGFNGHAARGIMSGTWDGDEMLEMRQGSIRFHEAQAKRMRKQVRARIDADRRALLN